MINLVDARCDILSQVASIFHELGTAFNINFLASSQCMICIGTEGKLVTHALIYFYKVHKKYHDHIDGDGQVSNTGFIVVHDDVIKWKHFRVTGHLCGGIHQSLVNSPHKSQWRRALMFSFDLCLKKGLINNQNDGDLRCHWAHYDITVMHGLNEGNITPWNPANFSQNSNQYEKIFFQEMKLDSGCSKSAICSGFNMLKIGSIKRIWTGTLVWDPRAFRECNWQYWHQHISWFSELP